MTNFKTGLKQDPKNLAQLVKDELEAVTKEAVNQVAAGAEEKDGGGDRAKSVTKSPPLPGGQEQDANLVSGREEASNEEEELRKVRARLLALNKESVLAREKLSQEREEIAKRRNPVVEGVGSDNKRDSEGQAGQEGEVSLPPFQTNTSWPKRGLPPWMGGQTEKRQRR